VGQGDGSSSAVAVSSARGVSHAINTVQGVQADPMSVWRQLLRRAAELVDQNGHAAIDATYFDR
jgi:hypothetical protein